MQNLADIKRHNEGESTFKRGVNQFTDMLMSEIPTGYVHVEEDEHVKRVSKRQIVNTAVTLPSTFGIE
jgi:hypothetical protein